MHNERFKREGASRYDDTAVLVNPVLLQELSESFRLHNQIRRICIPASRIKRGLRNADGTGVWSARAARSTFTATHTQRGRARANRGAS